MRNGAPHDAAKRPLAAPSEPVVRGAQVCVCGRPVFFGNSVCLGCGTALGYDPERAMLYALAPSGCNGEWHPAVAAAGRAPRFRRCANLDTAAACNWLVAMNDAPDPLNEGAPMFAPLCRSCGLTRMLPDLSVPENARWWRLIEQAKRRLVSSLVGLRLPVESKLEQSGLGLAFDLLRTLPGGAPIVTGHDHGVITLDVSEADDATREQRRLQFGEPYRTLLGHLRHESGHYYWQRLVDGSGWLAPCRDIFGDDQQDYAEALQRHYREGPAPDWGSRHVSAYASSHPWEDWAETWAHYLHLVDTLDTAHRFNLDGEHVGLSYERYDVADLGDGGGADGGLFLRLLNDWMELTGVLNELSRSMGVPDFYPFVLSVATVRKLFFVHRVVTDASGHRVDPS